MIMTIQDKTSQTIKSIEPSGNVIKGGYQEVSPSPSPAPPSGGTWGTAVPTSKPSDEQNPKTEPAHPPKK